MGFFEENWSENCNFSSNPAYEDLLVVFYRMSQAIRMFFSVGFLFEEYSGFFLRRSVFFFEATPLLCSIVGFASVLCIL